MSNTAIIFPYFAWNIVTSGATAVQGNQGYISNSGGPALQFTLPTMIGVGAIIQISNLAGGWQLNLNGGQNIIFGTANATSFIKSVNTGDGIQLVCVVANTTFLETFSQGNLQWS
jgi:hypothetical protein